MNVRKTVNIYQIRKVSARDTKDNSKDYYVTDNENLPNKLKKKSAKLLELDPLKIDI